MSNRGLSSAGLADGFVRGFGMMDQYQTNKQRREQSDQIFDRQKSEWDREDASRITQAMYEGVMSDNVDPEVAKQFEAKTGHVNWTDFIDPEYGNSLATMNNVLSGKADVNTPEGIAAVNRLYDREIKRGIGEKVGNKTIVGKRVNRVIPGRDGKSIMLNLAVEEEDEAGRYVRNAPVTGPNRSATDQEVKQIDLEQALSDLKGKMMVYEAIQKSPKLVSLIRQRAAKLGANLPEAEKQYGNPEQVAGIGMVQRGPNNQINVLSKEQETKPLTINGQLVDPTSGKVMGDYRDPQKPEKPISINGQLVDPVTYQPIGDFRDEDKKNPASKGLDSSVMSQIQQTASRYHGTFNPDGSFLGIPAGAREKYTEAMKRAEDLVNRGFGVFEAANIANLSVVDPLTPAKAKQLATQEAVEQDLGWGDKDKFIEERAQQLIQEQAQAIGLYQQHMSGGLAMAAQQGNGSQQPAPEAGLNVRSGTVDRSNQPKAPPEALNKLQSLIQNASPEQAAKIKAHFQNTFGYLPEGI